MSTRRIIETNKGRKRTKTFTGCWTCRARKVKCDEARPACRLCLDKNLVCQGYGARLQWLPPESGPGVFDDRTASSDLSAEGTQQRCLRRHIPAEPLQTTLSWHHIDQILQTIDATGSDPTQPHDTGFSLNIDNFGVFSQRQTLPSPPPSRAHAPSPVTASTQHTNVSLTDGPPDHYDVDMVSSPDPRAPAAWDLIRPPSRQSTPPLQLPSETPLDSTVDTPGILPEAGGLHLLGDAAQLLQPPRDLPQDSHATPDTPSIGSPAYVLGDQERYLLNHYINRVVNLFCVIDNANNPWKTIHLPIVLQSVGELSVVGSTSRVRNALRNAFLAISAFYLSNDHRTRGHRDESQSWANIASSYRYEAIGLLKEAIEQDLYTATRPKYNDFLVTMLSMVTVISGDTNSCSVHLDGAEQLINHISRKVKIHNESQVLHRIYFYLRVIYESTATRVTDANTSRFGPIFNTDQISSPGVPQDGSSDLLGTTDGDSTPLELSTKSAPFEFIYGIPHILLVMLKDTVDVTDLINRSRPGDRLRVPENIESLCDKLESEILDWPLDDHLNKFRHLDRNQFSIMYQQTKAFHNALIVYFSQNVCHLGFRRLRQYVEAVLDSIEAIEHIKSRTKGLAAPLFWPAFVAATEAFEPCHQERFREWYEKVEEYGIESARTGIQVLHEVWRRGPSRNRQQMTSWRCISEETGATLMLT
ncbi:fungal-specific transcription factor domain-containing protein [Xylariomycetidae sp. FL2044]|nr:fungal-specific transcription factor domain-containing protein [Xylariomycetidae sp. FL2044]